MSLRLTDDKNKVQRTQGIGKLHRQDLNLISLSMLFRG